MAEDEVEEKKPKGKKPIFLYIIVGLVLVLALAGGTAYYVVTHYMGSAREAHRDPGFLMKLGDPKDGFVVNIGPPNSGRFLKIGVIIELKPDKKWLEKPGKSLPPDETKIQDAALYVLRSQKVEDLDPSKQERLKEAIKLQVNKALGADVVYEVYITTLLLQ